MEESSILSVGIDIGTTTTQLVFSRLTLRNTAGPTQAPRYAITARELIYGSPVVFTPKISRPDQDASSLQVEDAIDEEALASLISSWYSAAGVFVADVVTGAVIITGESLKTPNAKQTVMRLSDTLGDFVVASAGPHLESVIAGRGSGAAALSQKMSGLVLNIDIGGGTSNYAVFQSGNVVDTACLNVGGRLVETDAEGNVLRAHKPGLEILEALYGRIPQTIHREHLSAMAESMADMLYDVSIGVAGPLTRRLMQTPLLKEGRRYDAVTISGGVGECCRHPSGNPFRYGDMGPLLAEAIMRNAGMRRLPLTPPASTVQATVIGAGSWSLSLSGSTVWAEDEAFPLRNVPVVTVPLEWPHVPGDLAAHIRGRISHFDIEAGKEPFVLAFGSLPTSYAVVSYLAEGLAGMQRELPKGGPPFIVAIREDIGKALGMELKPLMAASALIVVDEVRLAEGDYLDLGKPLRTGGFVPLVIKSLAFSGEGG